MLIKKWYTDVLPLFEFIKFSFVSIKAERVIHIELDFIKKKGLNVWKEL